MIGTTLSQYRITAKLGAGIMGKVYPVGNSWLGRQVATKVLPEMIRGNPEGQVSLEREARRPASLNHPNIAAICGLAQAEERRFRAAASIRSATIRKAVRPLITRGGLGS